MSSSNLREGTNALIFRNNAHPLKQAYVVNQTGLSAPTVSKCFKELTNHGVLSARREKDDYGKERTIYYISPEVVHVGRKPTKSDMMKMPPFRTVNDHPESDWFE